MQSLKIQPGGRLLGDVVIPGDKSITHRALIIGALATAGSIVTAHNWLQSLDCIATLNALQMLGVKFTFPSTKCVQIHSVGLHGLHAPQQILNVGNSGTAMRLLTGVLAAQKFSSIITGDASLCKRPMQRIITPLTQMGAKITALDKQFAPLQITGGQTLRAINYTMPMASAQVKSALLLASLYTGKKSRIISPSVCRDHTEVMLDNFTNTLNIPGDISAAAFFIVAATITPNSVITLRNIGFNPTRSAIITILRAMGANITLSNLHSIHGEPRADIRVCHTPQLAAINVPLELIANAIDEIPILCLAAACARGTTVIRGAQELRHKESDRIALLVQSLRNLGIAANDFSDGLTVTGGVISGGVVAAGGDHRMAMTFAMAGLVAQREIIVQDTDNIATSFPGFVPTAAAAGVLIEEHPCPHLEFLS